MKTRILRGGIFGIAYILAEGIGDMHEKANRRRPRWHRLPYGVPLCIGFLGYLFLSGIFLF